MDKAPLMHNGREVMIGSLQNLPTFATVRWCIDVDRFNEAPSMHSCSDIHHASQNLPRFT